MNRFATLAVGFALVCCSISCRLPNLDGKNEPLGYFVFDGGTPQNLRASVSRSPFYLRYVDRRVSHGAYITEVYEESGPPIVVEADRFTFEFSIDRTRFASGIADVSVSLSSRSVDATSVYPPVLVLSFRNRSSTTMTIPGRSLLYRGPDGAVQNLIREEMLDKTDQFVDLTIPPGSTVRSKFIAAGWVMRKGDYWALRKGLDSIRPGESFAVVFKLQGTSGTRSYEILIRRA